MVKEPDDAGRYAEAFLAKVREDRKRFRLHGEPGREIVYRPAQLLVGEGDVERVERALREDDRRFERAEGFAGTVRLLFADPDTDIPAVVVGLRDPARWPPEDPVPVVQPHHVLVGFGRIMGHPGGPPSPASALPDPDPARGAAGRGVTVGVCDTGIWDQAPARHAAWLGGSYAVEGGDEDPLLTPAGALDLQGGHGTFVAGVLRQAAPGVRFDPEKALEPDGFGDEESIARALAGLEPGVELVNLSLGCVTLGNVAPRPLAVALDRLGRDVVVVAAAGNAGNDRPSWPAAFKRVIAVAAVEVDGGQVSPAPDSSFGPWVDACAPGRHVSTYVDGTWQLPTDPGAVPFEGFAEWQGTSFAAPYVAGRIAEFMTTHGVPAREAARRLLDHPRWHPDYGVLVL